MKRRKWEAHLGGQTVDDNGVDVESDEDVDDEQDALSVDRLQENDYLQECLEAVQQEFMIFNREK